MNIKYKLYLSLGLLFSITESTTLAHATYEGYSLAQIEQYCDDVIHTIFTECFFNENDETLFSQIVIDILDILKIKRNSVDINSQQKYDAIIDLLEKNKDSSEFAVWAKILIAPELKAILPLMTQQFLDTIPNFKKAKTLINRLKNNS